MTSTLTTDSDNVNQTKELMTLNEPKDSDDNSDIKNNGTNILELDSEKDDYEEARCGFMGWSPNWLQTLASKKMYVIAFGILGMNQSALSAYTVGTISTIEKRFKLPSTTSGIMLSFWEVGEIAALMIMAYFGSAGHKTRWLAGGAFIAALSCYLRVVPHIIFGPGEIALHSSNSTTSSILCDSDNKNNENCAINSEGMFTSIILALAQFGTGTGTSAYYTLGAAYLDDNTLKNKFPILLASAAFIRYFGPTLGFLLSSYTLSIYIDTSVTPPFGEKDPQWIGAWYIGWLVFGSTEVILALFVALFPKVLPREAERRKISGFEDKSKVTSMADFKKTILRLMKNPILMFNTFSSTFYLFGVTSYWMFMPKYIEAQFRKTASAANLITGAVGLVCTAIGILISGSVVSLFKPRPTYLAAWNVVTETIDVIGHLTFAFIGCLNSDIHGSFNPDSSWNLTATCNSACDCGPTVRYSPVCAVDNAVTFYSPCHAGCVSQSLVNGTKMFQNCSCIPETGLALDGPCPVDCDQMFISFIVIMCVLKFLSSTGRTGNTVIQFRAVLPEDKAIALALTEVVMCIFSFIPAPIVYGWIVDSACLVWGMICGKPGNCWLYDSQSFRYNLNFAASGFLFIAVLLDVGVLWKVGKLKLYDEEDDSADEKEKNTKSKVEKPLINKFCDVLSS